MNTNIDPITDLTLSEEDSYRYSFQGQEKDDEIKGKNNSINYKYRMHDPRVGRFFAVDPLTVKYPQWSPYTFSGNRVLDKIELEGLEPTDKKDEEKPKILKMYELEEQIFKECLIINGINPEEPSNHKDAFWIKRYNRAVDLYNKEGIETVKNLMREQKQQQFMDEKLPGLEDEILQMEEDGFPEEFIQEHINSRYQEYIDKRGDSFEFKNIDYEPGEKLKYIEEDELEFEMDTPDSKEKEENNDGDGGTDIEEEDEQIA